jgi:hypothetical protein
MMKYNIKEESRIIASYDRPNVAIEELENLQQSYPTRHYSLETDDSPSSRNKFPQNEEK